MNINDRLTHWLNSKSPSVKEEREFAKLFRDKKSLLSIENELRSDWDLQEDCEEKNLLPLLHKLHYRINVESDKCVKSYKRKVIYWLANVAAVVFLAVGLNAAFLYVQKTDDSEVAFAEIQAPKNARVQFHLPDGTDGWLNSGAILRYPLCFAKNREVILSGEAFFSVARSDGKKNPFTVQANGASIVVWGTRFNVNADENSRVLELVLEEGEVQFCYKVGDQAESVKLNPGEILVYDDTHKAHNVASTVAVNHTQWINNRFVIRGESIASFAYQFGRRYNMDIVVADKLLEDIRFRATFENESPDEILRLLQLIVPISIQVEERQLLVDGTFTKKRVTIGLKGSTDKLREEIYE